MARMLTALLFVNILIVSLGAADEDGVNPFTVLDTAEKIISEGYEAETHHVTTSDGYILEMHRIPYKRYEDAASEDGRPVVFLMHGLMSASFAFTVLGANYSIAFNLADAGFDVWMGNARGNKNSRYHVTLDPDDEQEKYEFFDYSFEEIGMYDVAAMVDYILDYTQRSQLHYIGHSQGGTVFLVLGSMRPEYNDKFASVHLLAGVGYMQYFPDTELISLAAMVDIIYNMAVGMGMVEIYPMNTTDTIEDDGYRMSDYCVGDVNFRYMCDLVGVSQIMRNDDPVADIMDIFGSYESAGGSLKQIAHYGQNIRDKAFRRWSYGLFQNLRVYGSLNPPAYNLNLITSNVTMHYTVNDRLLDERDVLAMAADMPYAIVRKVARETFLHEDFAAAFDAKELVTDYIIEAIRSVPPPPQTDALDPVQVVDIDAGVEEEADEDSATDGEGEVDVDAATGGEGVEDGDIAAGGEEADGDSVIDVEDELIPTETPGAASGLVLSSLFNVYLIIYSLKYLF